MNTVVFNETINGRHVVIEALAVSAGRWRAQIVSSPGAITALMPFYGTTPDDAVQRLSAWLARAARPAS